MEEKLCGECSKKTGMSLEERIELALSRIPMEAYWCPICKQEHRFNRVIKQTPKAELVVEVPKPKKESKKKTKTNEVDQLLLF